jgi:alpha-galactosidase
VVNEKKIKCGLLELVRQINEIGLKFGIWFEPEMVSEDSDLYRAHPDWAMEIPGRHAVRSRNQLVLDVGRKEVQDYLIERDNVQIVASGMAFMHAGIPIPREIPEFTAFIYHLTAID